MKHLQEKLNILKSRDAQDEASILDTILFITTHIALIRMETSKTDIERMVIELILLNKHPSALVKQTAVTCLAEYFPEETRAIEQQVIALRLKKGLPL